GLPPGDVGRRLRQPRRRRRPPAADRAPQRPAAARLHAVALRARADPRRTRGAAAAVPPRRRAPGLPRRRAARRRLQGRRRLAATRLRRDHQAMRRRLTWLGARPSQILLVEAAEVAGITLVASAAGWAAGMGAGALLARHLGSPGALAVEHSVLTGRALAIAP